VSCDTRRAAIPALSLHDALPIWRDHAASSDRLYMARAGFTPDEDNEYGLTWYRQEGDKEDPPYAGTSGNSRFWAWPSWDKESLRDRKSTRLNSSHVKTSYAVFCL